MTARNRPRLSTLSGLIATWFGSGLAPMAPGTWGSLAALPFAWVLSACGGTSLLAAATVLIFFVGWWASSRVTAATGASDPGYIVVDEVAGQWLTLLAAPPEPLSYLAGFLLFRLFDITKPWPIRWADRNIPGGLGIMVDDILAGVFSLVILMILSRFWRG
jgi:phosphatidylglycerophosphatase A